MLDVAVDGGGRILERRPVGRMDGVGLQPPDPLERGEVGAQPTLGRGHQRRVLPAHHEVAAEDGGAVRPVKGDVVAGMAGCVHGHQLAGVGLDPVPLVKGFPGEHPDRGVQPLRQCIGSLHVVGVAVGDQHRCSDAIADGIDDGGLVRRVVRTGVDDRRPARPDDVRPRAVERQRRRVRREDRAEHVRRRAARPSGPRRACPPQPGRPARPRP